MREPMSKEYNQVVLTMSAIHTDNRYDVDHAGTLAPQTYEELCEHIDAQWSASARILVDGRHSEHTVFGDPEVNYAFRAWHDLTHYRTGNPFTLAGETAVCRMQQGQVRARFDGTQAEHACMVLWADIVGQRQYEDMHGVFPEDQRAFVEAYLISPRAALQRLPHSYAVKPDWAGAHEAHAWPACMPWTPPYDLGEG